MIALALALVAAPVTYQVQVYDGAEADPLTAQEAACVETETTSDSVRLLLRRNRTNFGQLCLTSVRSIATPIDNFVLLEAVPGDASFSEDGTTAYIRQIGRVCSPRGAFAAFRNCLPFKPNLGKVAEIDLRKTPDGWRLVEVWEQSTGEPNKYGQDRQQGKARSHTLEIEIVPEEAP